MWQYFLYSRSVMDSETQGNDYLQHCWRDAWASTEEMTLSGELNAAIEEHSANTVR